MQLWYGAVEVREKGFFLLGLSWASTLNSKLVWRFVIGAFFCTPSMDYVSFKNLLTVLHG
jgi:hypothetical protein